MSTLTYKETEVIDSLKVIGDSHEVNIGKLIKFKNPSCIIENETFKIGGIQKSFSGEPAYRVYAEIPGFVDTFGRIANFDAVYFI